MFATLKPTVFITVQLYFFVFYLLDVLVGNGGKKITLSYRNILKKGKEMYIPKGALNKL